MSTTNALGQVMVIVLNIDLECPSLPRSYVNVDLQLEWSWSEATRGGLGCGQWRAELETVTVVRAWIGQHSHCIRSATVAEMDRICSDIHWVSKTGLPSELWLDIEAAVQREAWEKEYA